RHEAYRLLETLGTQLEAGLREAAKAAGGPVQFNRCGSMFLSYFTAQPVHNLGGAMRSHPARFARLFPRMLAEGGFLAPSAVEAGFLSTAHTAAEVDRTVRAAATVMKALA